MDLEKTVEFILQHQAQFAAEMDQLKDRHKEFAAELNQLKDRHKELSDSVDALRLVVQSQQVQISQIMSLTQVLTESQRHTDERLNALIKVVDDLVRRNGGPR